MRDKLNRYIDAYRKARKRWRSANARLAAAQRNPPLGVFGSEMLNDLTGARDSAWVAMAYAAISVANAEDRNG